MSGLLAVGFSPIIRLIERQRFLPIGTRRFPRWLAILVSPVHHRGGRRNRVSDRAAGRSPGATAGRAPHMFERARVPGSKGLLRERLTIQEAVERTPASGRRCGEHRLRALACRRWVVRFSDAPDPDVLPAGRSGHTAHVAAAALAPARRARVDAVIRDITLKVVPGSVVSCFCVIIDRARPRAVDRSAVLYVLAPISGVESSFRRGADPSAIPVVLSPSACRPAARRSSSSSSSQQQVANHLLVPKIAGKAGRGQRRDRHRVAAHRRQAVGILGAISRRPPQPALRSSSASWTSKKA